MSQFGSELEANEVGAKFDALSRSPVGLGFARISKIVRSALALDPKNGLDMAEMIGDVVSAFREDAEARTEREYRFLLDSVVLTIERHEKAVGQIQDRLGIIETRIEQGLKVALRFPNDGSQPTLERLAIVVVRGAIDYQSNPPEQTSEFLRIAAQITESEVVMLRQIYEFQEGMSRQSSHAVNQSNWLANVGSAWVSMKRKYPVMPGQWMQRKSALVRLESYGFVEKVQGSQTSEGSEMAQMPYALLPLGREFCEYIRPI